MLDALLIAATIATAQPAADSSIAFNTYTDGIYNNKQELNALYPGLERFWASDAYGFFFKGSAKVAIAPGQVDGGVEDRAA